MDRDFSTAAGSDAGTRGAAVWSWGVRQGALIAAGLALAIWVWWWIASLSGFALRTPLESWLPVWRFLGLDLMHNYLGARAWLDGVNPYLQPFGDPRGLYAYPPIVLPLFGWAAWVRDPAVVVGIWVFVIAAGCGLCLWQVRRFRLREGLTDVPLLAMLALVLWSAPVVFAMERGNCDVLVLICIVFAAMALKTAGNRSADTIAGAFLALAAMIKIYPLMAIAVLIGLRRWRVISVMMAGVVLALLIPGQVTLQWLDVMKTMQGDRLNPVLEILNWLQGQAGHASLLELKQAVVASHGFWGSLHSPGNWWPAFWLRLGSPSIATWPLLVAQVVTLAPVTLWGLWRIYRATDGARLILPVLLWIMTAATFWMPLSYDYNLIYLPLLILALWDRRHAGWVHAALALSLLWWLPFGPTGYDWSLARVVLKLFAFHVVTMMLVRQLGLSGSTQRHEGRALPAEAAGSTPPGAVPKRLIPCNLCGSERFETLFPDELGAELPLVDYDFRPETRKTFEIVRCTGCGLVFTNPMPDLRTAYQDVVDPIYLASQEQRRQTARHALQGILKHVPAGGRLLDVGCNTGLFLDEAASSFRVEGVELSQWAAAEAAKRHTVHTVPISELDLPASFDVVTLFGVIEHFDDPLRELQAMARVLKPGGLFVVYTGDVDAWLPRLLGKRWWWYQGMHLYYFSLKTLTRMLDKAGFDVVANTNHVVYFQLFSLAKSLNRYAVGRLVSPALNWPFLKHRMVGLQLSGEMLVYSRRRA
jgi:SAM-dependent methyltransferase